MAKAKAVQSQFDKLMSKAVKGTINHRRQIDKVVNSTKLVNKMVDDIAKNTKMTSGFTRITPLPNRAGDNAPMARIEIIVAKPNQASVDVEKESKSKKK